MLGIKGRSPRLPWLLPHLHLFHRHRPVPQHGTAGQGPPPAAQARQGTESVSQASLGSTRPSFPHSQTATSWTSAMYRAPHGVCVGTTNGYPNAPAAGGLEPRLQVGA